MTDTVNSLYESGLERYNAGEKPEDLIPVFQEICDRAPKSGPAWASLAWLYLLIDKPKSALKAAQKSVKIDSKAPQSRINLALAMLDTGATGVRQHIEVAQQVMALDAQIRQDIEENIQDGLTRKPDWKSLERIKGWLLNP
jgi:tetratricopeptide (TPR) repeat protein